MKGIILGAGVTGLAAGIKTGYPIYEAESVPGGLCRSYYMDGFRFEKGGGHWIFGDTTQIEKFVELKRYTRKAGVYFNQIVDAPIQAYCNDIDQPTPGTMKDWMRQKFGKDLCKLFFDPFNEKYTAGLYDKVIQEYPEKSPVKGVGYNDTFAYPVGGLDKLVDKMAEGQSIFYNKEAWVVNVKDKWVLFSDGTKEDYDILISTIPLNKMLMLCGKVSNLPYSSVIVANLSIKPGLKFPKEHWLYIPIIDVPFFRSGFYTNVDKSFSMSGKEGCYVETAYLGDIKYIPKCFCFENWGWSLDTDIKSINHIEYAYTWQKREGQADEGLKFLKDNNIISIGRYGRWKFQGIAESIADGLGVEW